MTIVQINGSSSKPHTFFFCIKYRRAVSFVHSINFLKLEETRATVPNIFFTNLDAMFVDILLRATFVYIF